MSTLDRLRELERAIADHKAAYEMVRGDPDAVCVPGDILLAEEEYRALLIQSAPLLLAEIRVSRSVRDSMSPSAEAATGDLTIERWDAARAALDAAGEKDGGA